MESEGTACGAPHFHMDTKRLPELDHMTTAITKSAVRKDDVLEMAPALAFRSNMMDGTPMAPYALYWNDLDFDQQEAVRKLGKLMVQYQDHMSGWKRTNIFSGHSQLALLPVAGNIGMVHKIGKDNARANCRLELEPAANYEGSAATIDGDSTTTILLKLVATKDLDEGEALYLNLPDHSTKEEKELLLRVLQFTGQPVPIHLNEALAAVEEGKGPKVESISQPTTTTTTTLLTPQGSYDGDEEL